MPDLTTELTELFSGADTQLAPEQQAAAGRALGLKGGDPARTIRKWLTGDRATPAWVWMLLAAAREISEHTDERPIDVLRRLRERM